MPYKVIPLRIEEHQEALVKLWRDSFREPQIDDYADERFSWFYGQSPVDSAWTWLGVETESNAVIGCGSVIRADKYIGGRVVRAGVPALFAVEKKHRMATAALAIQETVIAESFRMGFDFLVAKPNKKAFPILSRVGYQTIGETQGWAKQARDGTGVCIYPDPGVYKDEVVEVADSRFEDLWETCRSQYRIIGEKTAAFMNWRYSKFKEQGYRFYCLIRRGDNQLEGYLAFYATRWGFFIADLLCQDARGPVLDNLLLGFASLANKEGQEFIALSYLGAPWFEDRLKQLGFTPDSNRRRLVVCANPRLPAKYRSEIMEKNNWFIFAGEMDLF